MQAHEQPPTAGEGAHGDAATPSVSSHYASGTGRKLQIVAGGVAVILLAAFMLKHYTASSQSKALAIETAAAAEAPALVEVASVRPASGQQALVLPGNTAAWYESSIYARVNGYVGKWNVDIGDRVKEGQVLATIETPELDAQLVAAKATLMASEADVNVRQAENNFALSTYKRWKESPNGVVSEQEREEKKAGYETAIARLAAARARVNVDQADVDRLTALEAFKAVTAPYAGTITQRRIDIGDLVTSGSAGQGSPLYRMAKNDPIRVFVDVPQSISALMKVGVPVDISVKDVASSLFKGQVTRTTEAVDPAARTLRVEIDIPNRSGTLVPGLYVQAGFQLPTTGLLQVPAAAVSLRASGPQVAVVDAHGVVRFRKVTIGRDDGSVVELASGVAEGERVILNVSSQIADGDTVKVVSERADSAGPASSAH